jgi:hypothetical protein
MLENCHYNETNLYPTLTFSGKTEYLLLKEITTQPDQTFAQGWKPIFRENPQTP